MAQPRHVPVLLQEVLRWLAPRPGGRYLDGTAGMGGHSAAILDAAPGARLACLDRDAQAQAEAAANLARFGDRARLFHLAFSRFEEALDELGWDRIDGALLDLGVSSLQLDEPERGFSFLADGPLDMRMDPSSGRPPARVLVNKAPFERLAAVIGGLGEEPLAGRIAKAIIRERARAEIATTLQLARIVEQAYPPARRAQARNHPATRTFQGLRIEVNGELEELRDFLKMVMDRLNPGARLVVISFHSLEDRVVKNVFRDEARGCVCPPRQPLCTCGRKPRLRVLTRKPLTPGEDELAANPRSRSAKLRCAERTDFYMDEGGRA